MTNNSTTCDAYSTQKKRRLVEEFFGSEIRERAELEFLPQLLETCDRFIDIGANIGQYMYHANRVLHGAEVVGVEANSRLIPLIREVAARAEKENPNGNSFRIENMAVTDQEGMVDFYVTDAVTTSSLFAPAQATQKASVPASTLDALYRPSRKTVIKMDIEGAEYRALATGRRFLASDHTQFFLELHGWGDRSAHKYPLDVCSLMRRHGYGVRKIGSHYLFSRASAGPRFLSHLRTFPLLFCKHLIYRFVPCLAPRLVAIADGLSKAGKTRAQTSQASSKTTAEST